MGVGKIMCMGGQEYIRNKRSMAQMEMCLPFFMLEYYKLCMTKLQFSLVIDALV